MVLPLLLLVLVWVGRGRSGGVSASTEGRDRRRDTGRAGVDKKEADDVAEEEKEENADEEEGDMAVDDKGKKDTRKQTMKRRPG